MKLIHIALVAVVALTVNAAAEEPKASAQPVRTIFERHDQSGVPGKEIVIGSAMLPAGTAIGYHTHPGDEAKRVQACNACHGPDGVGVPHAAPYLAGQSAEFLASALKAFKDGTRKNDAGELMRSVAERLDDADIAAVTGYFASVDLSTH